MPTDHRAKLAAIKRFDQLIAYLRDEMGWPIARDSFEEVDDLFYDFTADELGIDPKTAAKIQEIKRLRPLSPKQPWGIFFVKFEPKKLPVVALRRILSQVALKKRASANSAERAAWAADDLLFVSNYGEGDERQISFAHFARSQDGHDLPTLKVLGWDNLDTALHLDAVARELTEHLAWPEDDADANAWREQWRAAFTLRHREVVTTSKDLSIRLAELARNIRDRIKSALAIETDNGPLTKLMKAFQTALVHDLDAGGFADMYAQTIAYGLLSARIADPHRKTADDFAGHMRTNPFLRDLMETFLQVGGRRGKAGGPGIDFDELGVSEVVDLLDDANMEAVVLDFGDRNPQEDPVIHFYELFLKEYDAKKRMQRGVFYTPRPVVSYIVRSVDELLRTEFGLADGLADTTTWGEMAKRHKDLKIPEGVSPDQDFVQILDPATGTGTFLVEVIDLIRRSLGAKWKAQAHDEPKIDALWNEYVPRHLLTRLYGYELLMTPYAIAHLKIGLKLYETGYRFGSHERARVYLTNALEAAQDFSGRFEFAIPALAHEATAVNSVKDNWRFTVVLGNPPYAGHSLNNQVTWLVDKVYDYKRGYSDLQKPGQAKWLQDDYVKFLRFAEWQVELTGRGIVGFITNHAWLDNATFKGMRRHFLDHFDRLSVLDLHGNANKKEVAPDGTADENVFEIKQGVAVSLLRHTTTGSTSEPVVERADLFGGQVSKYETLVALSSSGLPSIKLKPLPPDLLFTSLDEDRKREYDAYLPIPTIMGQNGDPAPGIVTTHDEFAISFSRKEQIEKVEAFLATRTEAEARSLFTLCSQDQWVYSDAKRALRTEDWRKELVRVLYRPFDTRWTIYSRYVAVHRRERVSQHLVGGQNIGLITTRQTKDEFAGLVCDTICGHKAGSRFDIGYVFPLWLEPPWSGSGRLPNLSRTAIGRLSNSSGLAVADRPQRPAKHGTTTHWDGRGDLRSSVGPRDVFDFIYSILHSGAYRNRYGEFLKSDFARIPLTPNRALLRDLVDTGTQLVALHLLDSKALENPRTRLSGRQREVSNVGWTAENGGTAWIDGKGTAKGFQRGTSGFAPVPEGVWNFHIGGYQVCQKWLKDRKGRTLSDEEITHYNRVVVALAETIRLMREIDEVIEEHGGWPGAFQAGEANTTMVLFRPRTVEPATDARYGTCVPLVPLKAAAGVFGDPQRIEDDGFEWVEVGSRHRLRPGMFVAQVVGKSMQPSIPDGAWCLFRAPVEGARQGKTVLVQLRDAKDPETGERYTVKRYESEKAADGESWRHERITLRPVNSAFEPILLTGEDAAELHVIAELVEVLGGEA